MGETALEDRARALAPLVRAGQIHGLTPVERDVLLLASAVEIDSRYGRLIAFLNDHEQRPRPTIGLALRVLGVPESERVAVIDRLATSGPLRRFELVMAEADSRSRRSPTGR